MIKYNDVPFVPCNDCSNFESCQEEAYEQGRADVIEELLTTKKYDELSQKIALDVFERGIKKGRADERKKLLKSIRAELHPCKDCPQKCEEQGFFESACVVDHTISYLDLWNLLERIDSEV